MSYCYAIAWTTLGIEESELRACFGEVDRLAETGTFYPKANITVLPAMHRSEHEMAHTQLLEAIRVQDDMVRANNMVFDFRFTGNRTLPYLYEAERVYRRRNRPNESWAALFWAEDMPGNKNCPKYVRCSDERLEMDILAY